MPRISIFNILLGFGFILLASFLGFFLAQTLDERILQEQVYTLSWTDALKKSSHAHTNLFGMLHILFGLTLPYSTLKNQTKRLQTGGLFLGSLAMSVLLFCKAITFWQPINSVIGAFLMCAYLALFTHFYGILQKLKR